MVKIRIIWIMVMKKPRAKRAMRAIFYCLVDLLVYVEWEGKGGRGPDETFCACRSCKDHRTGRGRAIMTMSKPRLVPVVSVMNYFLVGVEDEMDVPANAVILSV